MAALLAIHAKRPRSHKRPQDKPSWINDQAALAASVQHRARSVRRERLEYTVRSTANLRLAGDALWHGRYAFFVRISFVRKEPRTQ